MPCVTYISSELEREANIAKNKLLLQQLELKQAVDGLGISKAKAAKSTAKPVQPAKKEKRKREEPDQPRRQSARLRKSAIDPNESPAKRRKREVCLTFDTHLMSPKVALSA